MATPDLFVLFMILLAVIFVIDRILKSPIDLFIGFGKGSWFLIKRHNKK